MFVFSVVRNPHTVDYILVGQGLAGSCVALQLLFRNKKVMVFDLPADNHATAVAAGLFNPVTGKGLAKTWLADSLFSYLLKFYPQAERFLQRRFFFPMTVYRPFLTVQEQNDWMGKSADRAFAEYIEQIFITSTNEQVYDPFGGLLLKRSGYVDVTAFVEATRTYLVESGAYRPEKIDPQKIEVTGTGVRYGDVSARKIIFCDGVACRRNPYFSWLPVTPLKGETIQVRTGKLRHLYNRGVYIVPGLREGEYTVGATYNLNDVDPGVTREGRLELETKLDSLIRLPYTVINQNWGIRPTTLDQKLILGPHPVHSEVIIFNGLGTKGVSLAPYFSDRLVEWLEHGGEIMREVNISRFKALYSKYE
jgi:glycine oxidase